MYHPGNTYMLTYHLQTHIMLSYMILERLNGIEVK